MFAVVVNGKTRSKHKTRNAAANEAQRIREHNRNVLAQQRKKHGFSGKTAPRVEVKSV